MNFHSQQNATPNPKYLVPVVVRTFKILERIARPEGLTLNEVIGQTGVPKATAFRVLTTLCHLGYALRDERKRYYASPLLATLVGEDAVAEAIKHVSLPYMIRLRDAYGETVNLGRLHQGQIRYLEVAPSEYALRLHETPGATVSLHASGLGKATLAFLPADLADKVLRNHQLEALTDTTITDLAELMATFDEIRAKGFARDRGETSALATCVAAPIFGADGRPVAALSISGPTARFNPPDGAPVIVDLIAATTEISRRLRKPNPESSGGDA